MTTTKEGEDMRKRIGRLAALLAAFALAISFAPAGFAGGNGGGGGGGDAKCNSGNGNGSETTPETDCDPGNSGGHNQGGD
jgi:hypothetical protein